MSKVDPLIGRIFLGRYRVVKRLAKGGMGVIYLARAEGAAGFSKPVVIKRILPELDEGELVGMFVREAKILGNLRHPGIAGIVDFAEEDGAYLMVLEYVHGYDLGRWRRYVAQTRGPFDFELAVHVMIKVLEALHYAHNIERPDGSRLQVVHRDISPSNVVVDTEGHVKLLDFGVARMEGETSVYKTETFTVKGKLPYISPEQLGGQEPSASSDVYAAAVVLHELLSGKNEFRGGDAAETVARILSHVPSRISAVRKDVPPELDDLIRRATAKSPADRVKSAEDFADALRALRVLNTEEAQADLLQSVQHDYEQMPEAMGIEPLDAREEAWRNPPVEKPETLRPRRSETTQELPAISGGEEPVSTQPSSTASTSVAEVPVAGRSPALYVGVGLLVASAVAGGFVVAGTLFGGPPATEQVFVVQQPGTREAVTPPEGDSPDSASPDGATEEPEVAPDVEVSPEAGASGTKTSGGSAGRGGHRVPPRGEALTATFAREGSRVEACLRTHAASIEGRPTLDVRFTLRQTGEVAAVQVSPAEISSTPLGRCIAGVARSLRFAPQDRDGVSFRIPITVQRR